MLARLLFTFAALAFSTIFAVAKDIPAKLAPPQDRPLVGKYAAKGVQIYVCRAEGVANEWEFKAPEAELTDAQGRSFAKHYAGPTWEARDGSKIVGKVLANEPAPKAGAIPWLLLSTDSSGSVYLPAYVSPNGSTPLAESGQPVRVRRPEPSAVSSTGLTTSSTSDQVRRHRFVADNAERPLVGPSGKVHQLTGPLSSRATGERRDSCNQWLAGSSPLCGGRNTAGTPKGAFARVCEYLRARF
jgi:hypothetical protein